MAKTPKPYRPRGAATNQQLQTITGGQLSYKQVQQRTGLTRTALRLQVRAGLERYRQERRQ